MGVPAVLAGGLATAIVAGLASGGVQIAIRVLAGLGMGYVTFTGADMLVTQNKDQVLTLLGTLPPVAQQMIGVLKVGTCISILFSALVMRLTIYGLDAGVIKRMQVVG